MRERVIEIGPFIEPYLNILRTMKMTVCLQTVPDPVSKTAQSSQHTDSIMSEF